MAIGDLWESQLSFQNGSVPTLVVPHWRETANFVPDGARVASQSLADAIHQSGWMQAMLDCMSEDIELLSIYIRKVAPAPGIPYLKVIGASLPNIGGGAINACPSQAAMLVTLYSDEASRNGRGRIYIPGCPDTGNAEGLLNTVQLGKLQEFCDLCPQTQVMVGPDTGEFRLTVYSPSTNTNNLVVVATPHGNMGTIRGRRQRPGVG